MAVCHVHSGLQPRGRGCFLVPFADPASRAARSSKAARMRRWRARHLATPARARPFAGVDGEGAGADELGRQRYLLLRAEDEVLWRRGRPLSTEDCLGFLADLPKDRAWVGYYFDYDATQILRDLEPERLARLLAPVGRPFFRWVDWRGFQVDYLPRKYLRVRRRGARSWTTVSDVGAFFQSTFLAAVERWGVGTPAERALVAAGKARRGRVHTIDARERAYNALEVRLLADLMERFREACGEVGYLPRAWQGPGYLASAMLARHGVPRREELNLPEDLLDFANAAYYGGRFEVFQVGEVEGPIFGHDLNSAYPRALLDLPCLAHGKWREGQGGRPAGDEWVAEVAHWKRVRSGELACDLPVRTKGGTITWPRRAGGIYWRCEVEAAEEAGTRATFGRWWGYRRECDCRPFAWVPEVYEERRRLGKDGRGLVLKLALNSVYGKLAQSVGASPYANPIWAGLVTARTRAEIARAYRGRERDLVMVATDGVFTRGRVLGDLQVGEGLGEWTVEEHPGVFVVQPGFYFLGPKVKTRGASRRSVEPLVGQFHRAWRRMLPRRRFEPVVVPEILFTGLRLAMARGKPETAGRWVRVERRISFDWSTKRGGGGTTVGGAVQTFSQRGHSRLRSVPYDRAIGRAAELERMEREAQPDFCVGGNDR